MLIDMERSELKSVRTAEVMDCYGGSVMYYWPDDQNDRTVNFLDFRQLGISFHQLIIITLIIPMSILDRITSSSSHYWKRVHSMNVSMIDGLLPFQEVIDHTHSVQWFFLLTLCFFCGGGSGGYAELGQCKFVASL